MKPSFCCVRNCDCIKTLRDDCINITMCVGDAFSLINDTTKVKGYYFCRKNKSEGWYRFFVKEEYLSLFASLADLAKTYKEK